MVSEIIFSYVAWKHSPRAMNCFPPEIKDNNERWLILQNHFWNCMFLKQQRATWTTLFGLGSFWLQEKQFFSTVFMMTFLVHFYCFDICSYEDLKNGGKQLCICQVQVLLYVL